ncbi:hypothetical protein CYLTODRAFT_421826 [Cylindrobasidium torrendii FP15055 ss-10]|uniref:MYND-type domain-containing protein n=1 Tax=Cylindrobasidium torrendii FP15055 ss-10 TaxID=1314674 RepID=A0A0D7BCJ7_9AGAR|nr:hypothetical protein CYLTODRAFT_421826 [Cylindrobasidium torrendii FP15055 ss-10]
MAVSEAHICTQLIPFLVWPSVRKACARQLRAIHASGVRQRLDAQRPLALALNRLEAAVEALGAEMRHFKQSYMLRCENEACPNPSKDKCLYRCTGCYQYYFCSKLCQREVWRTRHRDLCRSYQECSSAALGLSLNESMPLRDGDTEFLVYLVCRDIRDRTEEINEMLKTHNSALDHTEPPALWLNYHNYAENQRAELALMSRVETRNRMGLGDQPGTRTCLEEEVNGPVPVMILAPYNGASNDPRDVKLCQSYYYILKFPNLTV